MEHKEKYAQFLAERLAKHKERLTDEEESYARFLRDEPPGDDPGYMESRAMHWDDIDRAEQRYGKTCSAMRELLEGCHPGRFDAIEKMHQSGIIDHTEMINLWVEAVQQPPSSVVADLPEGLG